MDPLSQTPDLDNISIFLFVSGSLVSLPDPGGAFGKGTHWLSYQEASQPAHQQQLKPGRWQKHSFFSKFSLMFNTEQ